jgi:hypothetical protein
MAAKFRLRSKADMGYFLFYSPRLSCFSWRLLCIADLSFYTTAPYCPAPNKGRNWERAADSMGSSIVPEGGDRPREDNDRAPGVIPACLGNPDRKQTGKWKQSSGAV